VSRGGRRALGVFLWRAPCARDASAPHPGPRGVADAGAALLDVLVEARQLRRLGLGLGLVVAPAAHAAGLAAHQHGAGRRGGLSGGGGSKRCPTIRTERSR
jgi:hypothetical protein